MNAFLKAESWSFRPDLCGYVWRAPNPVGRLLLQHGYAEYSERFVDHYHHLIPHFVGLGFEVYAFDMRGHGRSSGPRAVLDLRQAVDDHLAARHAIGGQITLFGNSLGGLVTAASVTQEQHDVTGVILSAPAFPFESSWTTRAIVGALAKIAPKTGLISPQPATRLSRITAEVEAFEQDPLIYRGKMPAKLASTALTVARAVWKQAPAWSVPTLIVHGTSDSYTDYKESKRFEAAIRSSDKRLMLIPNARHELLNDQNRDEVLQTITDWVGARVSRRTA